MMKFRNGLLIGLILLSTDCFAIKPEDMEPNKWYETIPIAPMLQEITCIPEQPGLIFGIGRYYSNNNRCLFKSTDYGVTWAATSMLAMDLRDYSEITLSRINGKLRLWVDTTYVNRCEFAFSDDLGETWTVRPSEDDVFRFAASPHSNLLIRARNTGANPTYIERSTDSGLTWNQHHVITYEYGFVASINFSPYDPNLILLGATYPEMVIMKSADSGLTWENMVSQEQFGSHPEYLHIIFHPENPSILITVNRKVGSNASLRVSYDFGQTWSSFGPLWNACDLYIVPENPLTMLVNGRSCSSLYRTTDGGSTWKTILRGINVETGEENREFEASPWEPGVVYVPFNGILKSRDNGVNWTALTINYPTSGFISHNHPGLMLMFDVEGAGRFVSTDWGSTWESLPGFISEEEIEQMSLLELPQNPALFLFARNYGACRTQYEGCLYRSTDLGRTWNLQINAVAERFFRLTPSEARPSRLFALLDNRATTPENINSWVGISDDEGGNWRLISFPDAPIIQDIVDSSGDPNSWYVLACSVNDPLAQVLRTTDDGVSWIDVGKKNSLQMQLYPSLGVGEIILDSSSPQRIYVEEGEIYFSENEGISWSYLTNSDGRLAVSEKNPRELLITKSFNSNYYKSRSVDQGITWSDPVFPIWTAFVPNEEGIVFDRATLRMMKIRSNSPKVLLGGYGNTRLQAGQSSSLVVAGVAQDPDVHDKVMRIDLLLEDIPTGVSIRDDVLPDSGLYFTQSEATPGQSGMWLLNFQAVDYFGNSDSQFPRLHTRP